MGRNYLGPIFAIAVLAGIPVAHIVKEYAPVYIQNYKKAQVAETRANEEVQGLVDRVMRKAQRYDGLTGLSFADQTELARRFGYGGVIREKVGFNVFLYRKENTNGVLSREVYPGFGREIISQISRKKLEDYLKK